MFSPGRNEDPPSPRWRTYTRADIVRAIVGQQWAVAIACHVQTAFVDDPRMPPTLTVERIASLPCAVDVVEEMEKA
jgi:hypothetical protein